jgi:hypothetical protein
MSRANIIMSRAKLAILRADRARCLTLFLAGDHDPWEIRISLSQTGVRETDEIGLPVGQRGVNLSCLTPP